MRKVITVLGAMLSTIMVGAAVVAGVLLALVWAGVVIGAANAWILQGTFSAGWHAVWGRWLVTLLWSILFLGGSGSVKVRWRR